MRELKCPKCGNVFSVDEADYASIVNQVKGAEFDAEVSRRIAELHKQHQAEEQARAASKEQEHQSALFKKDQALSEKDGEIARLKEQISAMGDRQKLAVGNAVADKDKIIAELRAAIAQKESAIQIAVLEEQQKAKESLQVKEAEIAQLRSDAKLDKSRAELHEKVIREDYENRLKVAQEQVDYYKDLKTFPAECCATIVNPLSQDLNVMRQTLILGGLEVIAYNLNRQISSMRTFEYGSVYRRDPEQSGQTLDG